jgi:predicted DNA-binding protein (UPF0251 family)
MAAGMDDLITTERVGIVVHRLAHGEAGSTLEIAEWVGLTRQSAWKMLDKLSRVIPIVLVNGRWCSLQGNVRLLQCDADD